MNDLNNLEIFIGQLRDGAGFTASTGASPYFCVHSDTEAGAIDLAKRAIGFYKSVLAKHNGQIPQPASEFRVTRTITVRELEAA